MTNNLQIIQNKNKFQSHSYHLVEQSPWPFFISWSLFFMAIGAVLYMHGYNNGGQLLSLGFILTGSIMYFWLGDVITEGTFLGHHTKEVKNGLMIGFILFVISEVFVFISVFWAYFHSSIVPSVEIGGYWPPLGIVPLNPFSIPLLNTFLLLSSGAFITYAHHAFIAGRRVNTINSLFMTILLAVIFTLFQYIEYTDSSFSMSDSVFGNTFFASTGLHGLITVAPTNYINKTSNFKAILLNLLIRRSLKGIQEEMLLRLERYYTTSATPEQKLFLRKEGNKSFYLDTNFVQWLSGFTDAEGNFNISLRNFKDNKYNSVVITFQIGLHIDDLPVLKFIQTKLNCGHISISGNRCNYFVNDQYSLINIILPIFNHVQLNSSKYYQFLVFEKTVNLIKNKKHLSFEGKLEIIKYYHEMKNINLTSRAKNKKDIFISDYWLGGFTDGDASFSISTSGPRLKFENHEKELELFQSIKEFLNHLIILSARKNKTNSNTMVILEINNIHILNNLIISLYNKNDSNFRVLQKYTYFINN